MSNKDTDTPAAAGNNTQIRGEFIYDTTTEEITLIVGIQTARIKAAKSGDSLVFYNSEGNVAAVATLGSVVDLTD